MPCLIVTGYPSAGKTTLSSLLKERALLHKEIDDVLIINEESACPDHTKNECYLNSLREKTTRGALKSAFDRTVGKSEQKKRTLVILDSLNYIKGFRYELHCISKASGERHGVLWVLNRTNVVGEWNSQRSEQEAYHPDLLKQLIQRYEPPDKRKRWDKPLFTIDLTPPGTPLNDSKSEAVKQSVYNMYSLGESLEKEPAAAASVSAKNPPAASLEDAPTKKPKKSAFSRTRTPAAATPAQPPQPNNANNANADITPIDIHSTTEPIKKREEEEQKSLEQQLDDILDSFLLEGQPLKEGNSTKQYIAGNADVLQEMDSITQRLISSIASAQTLHTGGKLQLKTAGGIQLSMNCPRRVALPELRRLRKQYLQWVAIHPPEDSTEKGIATSFLKYLEVQS
jgi:protein KTI12